MLHLQRSLKISFKRAARASVTVTLIFITVASSGDDHASPWHPIWEGRPKNLWIALCVAWTPSKQFPLLSFFFNQNLSWLKHTCTHPWDRNIQAVSLPPASVKNLLRSCQTMTSLRILETGNAALNIHRVTFIQFCVYISLLRRQQTFVTPLFIATGC